MLDDFVVRAILGGVGVAALAGPLGGFVVWRRMAFFGHALAHSALLGIALGALLAIDLNLATVTVCLPSRMLLGCCSVSRRCAPTPSSASSPMWRWPSAWSR